MNYFVKENSAILFLLAVFLLGTLNILTYPYIPFRGLIVTSFFMSLSLIAVVLRSHRRQSLSFYWVLFSSFNLTVLLSRVFVNSAGIGTPRSTGKLGFLTVKQLWVQGFHLHHYWLGFILLLTAFFMFEKKVSMVKTAAVLGVSIALIGDELGIILYGHTYHSSISYISIVAANTLLFLLYLKSEDRTELL